MNDFEVTLFHESHLSVDHLMMLKKVKNSIALKEKDKSKHITQLFIQGYFNGSSLTLLLQIFRALPDVDTTDAPQPGYLIVHWEEQEVTERN